MHRAPIIGSASIHVRLEQIRIRLEHRTVERIEFKRMCTRLQIPDDFNVAQINWKPDHDASFYASS
jgi:hypothetical protein